MNKFKVTVTESFEYGRIEGMKEAFKELLDLNPKDFQFFKGYLSVRLSQIENNIKVLESEKRKKDA